MAVEKMGQEITDILNTTFTEAGILARHQDIFRWAVKIAAFCDG